MEKVKPEWGVFMETEEKKQYTIEDIARELGVSKTTVSRAISGKGRIGQATRQRVLDFIEEHDYRPNVLAKGLAQRKTYNLALILPKDYAVTEFPFFKDCMNGICEVASAYDYDIIISMAGEDDLSQIRRIEANRKADGIIVSRSIVNSELQKYLKKSQIPFVLIGSSKDPEVLSVDNKNREASRELTSVLLMKGAQKLALLGGNHTFYVTDSRCQGFLDAYENTGKQADQNLIFKDCDNQSAVNEAVSRSLENGAEGIVCMDDVICNMCMISLHEKNIRIPEDMKVASLYDSHSLEYNDPPVTGVKFDTVRLGKLVCAKLLRKLGETPEEDTRPLGYQVILRESTH